jgi:thiamine-phosphate pyrophosphorylase
MRARSEIRRGLYAITPDEPDTATLLALARAAIAGGAVMVQYRNKSAAPGLRRSQAEALATLCAGLGAALVVNDDVRLALDVDAAGAHLGAGDGDIAEARRQLGDSRLLGASCYNRFDLAAAAVAAGAGYVAFGSFFASMTKPGAVRAEPALIERAKRSLAVPVAAIGGIAVHNAASLVAAGADWLCVVSALFDTRDPGEAEKSARQFATLFGAAAQIESA